MDPTQQPAPVTPEAPQPIQPQAQAAPIAQPVTQTPVQPPVFTPAEQPQVAAQPVSSSAPKLGKWQTSKSLLRSSWRVLMLDKELVWLPILSGLTAIGVTIAVILLILFSSAVVPDGAGGNTYSGPLINGSPIAIAFFATIYLLTTFTANYFSAALIAGAIERFKGGNPTIKASLNAANAHIGPLFMFSLLASTIGYVLQAIEERVPLAGKIAVWLVGAAWSIASMFSVAVIVTSGEKVGPIEATKRSMGIIKRTWGENVILSIGLGLVAVAAVASYFVLSSIVWAIATQFSYSAGVAIPLFILTVLGFTALLFIISMLSAIVKAAIFYYASTGRAPQEFEAQLLQASFTTKKARNIFTA